VFPGSVNRVLILHRTWLGWQHLIQGLFLFPSAGHRAGPRRAGWCLRKGLLLSDVSLKPPGSVLSSSHPESHGKAFAVDLMVSAWLCFIPPPIVTPCHNTEVIDLLLCSVSLSCQYLPSTEVYHKQQLTASWCILSARHGLRRSLLC
jgi:hypothetical protein